MAGGNDSKEFIDTYGFLSSNPSFFEQVISFLKLKQEPSSLAEAVSTIRECIDFYQSMLLGILRDDPYSKVHAFVLETLRTQDLLVGNSPIEDLLDFQRRIKGICENPGRLVEYEIGKDFKKYKDGYMDIVNRIVLVRSIMPRENNGTFLYFMKAYSMLATMEIGAMKEFFKSENYIKHANRPKIAKGQNKRWEKHNEETIRVALEVIKRMAGKDLRLHDKIVDEEVHKFNDPITNPIRKKLRKKYPDYDIDGHQDMAKYKKDYADLTRGKIISKDAVNEIVFPFARDVFGQANDPKKGSRKTKPLLPKTDEDE